MLIAGAIFVLLLVAGCGGGDESVETSSGAPPRDSYLKADFEHRFRRQNDPVTLKCEGPPTINVIATQRNGTAT